MEQDAIIDASRSGKDAEITAEPAHAAGEQVVNISVGPRGERSSHDPRGRRGGREALVEYEKEAGG